jgi:hypothetical protein
MAVKQLLKLPVKNFRKIHLDDRLITVLPRSNEMIGPTPE